MFSSKTASPLDLLHIRKHNGFVTKLLHYTIAFTFNRCASQGLSLLNIFIFIPQLNQCVSSFFLCDMIDLMGLNKSIYSCGEMLKGVQFLLSCLLPPT